MCLPAPPLVYSTPLFYRFIFTLKELIRERAAISAASDEQRRMREKALSLLARLTYPRSERIVPDNPCRIITTTVSNDHFWKMKIVEGKKNVHMRNTEWNILNNNN